MDGSEPTPPGIQRYLAGALIELGTMWRLTGSRLITADPPPGSGADRIRFGTTVGASALGPVSRTLAAASDHFQALARLLRMPETFGPSIAALTRAALESLARAWWVMSAPDAAAANHRAALMHLHEVRAAARFAPAHIRSTRTEGHPAKMNADEAVNAAQRVYDAVRVDTEPTVVPGYTVLVTGLLVAAGDESARSEYSHLSGVAHGEVFTVSGFGSHAPGASSGVGSLKLPNSNLFMYLWTLTHAVDVCLTRWFELWVAPEETERWGQARERAYTTLQELQELVDHYDPHNRDLGGWEPGPSDGDADITTAFGGYLRRAGQSPEDPAHT